MIRINPSSLATATLDMRDSTDTAQDVASVVEQHGQCQVHSLGAHDIIFTNLDPQRIQEHDRVRGPERRV